MKLHNEIPLSVVLCQNFNQKLTDNFAPIIEKPFFYFGALSIEFTFNTVKHSSIKLIIRKNWSKLFFPIRRALYYTYYTLLRSLGEQQFSRFCAFFAIS